MDQLIINSEDWNNLTNCMSTSQGQSFAKYLDLIKYNATSQFIFNKDMPEYERGYFAGVLHVLENVSNNIKSKMGEMKPDEPKEDIKVMNEEDEMQKIINALENK